MAPQSLHAGASDCGRNPCPRIFPRRCFWFRACLMLRRPAVLSLSFRHTQSRGLLLFRRQETCPEVSENIIRQGLRDGNVRIVREARRLETDVAEFHHKGLQRHTVLQGNGSQRGDGVHKPGDRAAFFGHFYENLADFSVFVKARVNVSLLAGHFEFVANSSCNQRANDAAPAKETISASCSERTNG